MSEIICHCFEVSREEIENAIREKGLKTVEEVGEVTNAGTGCGGCQEQIQEILDEINFRLIRKKIWGSRRSSSAAIV